MNNYIYFHYADTEAFLMHLSRTIDNFRIRRCSDNNRGKYFGMYTNQNYYYVLKQAAA